MAAVPSAARDAVIGAATRYGRRLSDTAVLSNVGFVPGGWVGPQLPIARAGCAPPAVPALLGVGVGTSDTELCRALTNRREGLGDDAAARLAAQVVEELEALV
jgi:hypothetical protein